MCLSTTGDDLFLLNNQSSSYLDEPVTQRMHRLYACAITPSPISSLRTIWNSSMLCIREESDRWMLMMNHSMPSMSMVKDPSKCFSQIISKIENARCVFHQNISLLSPYLNYKELHINMIRASGWLEIGWSLQLQLLVEYCQLLLCKARVLQDRSKISSWFGNMYCCNKFCLGRACGDYSL